MSTISLETLQALLAPAVEPVTLLNGQTVYVREVPAGAAEDIGPRIDAATTAREKQHLIAALYLANEHGQPLCDPSVPEQLAVVAGLGFNNLRRILAAGDKLNALPTEGEGEKKS